MLNVVKGVVEKIPVGSNPGLIKCGNGKTFPLPPDPTGAYKPEVNDIVQVEEDDGAMISCKLYHRQGYVPQREATVDLRIKCPHCGEKMMPKAKWENGRISSTFCPYCNQTLEEYPEEPKGSGTFMKIQWMFLIAALILLGIALFAPEIQEIFSK